MLSKYGLFEVINCGTRGYGTDQSYLFLQKEAYKYNPDIVICLFCKSDPKNNITIHRAHKKFGKSYFIINDKGAFELRGVPVPLDFKKWEDWHKDRLVNDAAKKFANRSSVNAPAWFRSSEMWCQLREMVFLKCRSYLWVGNVAKKIIRLRRKVAPTKKETEEMNSMMLITEKLIKEMANFSKILNARFFIFKFSNGVKPDTNKWLIQICKRNHISLLDPSNAFFEISRGKRYFCTQGPHWNEKGHLAAAKKIKEFLLEKGWI